MKEIKKTIDPLKRLTFSHVNVARVVYNELVNTIDLQVIMPGVVAEQRDGDKFVVFTTQKDLMEYA